MSGPLFGDGKRVLARASSAGVELTELRPQLKELLQQLTEPRAIKRTFRRFKKTGS
jgi:hypothetical protein